MNQVQAIYRIIDANFNRAREGLRVLEELVRLGFDDHRLTVRCREMRHALARYAENVPGGYPALLAGREAQSDVGSGLWPEEKSREGLFQLVAANCKRVQEALRVLEEYAKLLSWPVAELKALRFASYELEKTIILFPGVGDARTGPGSGGRGRVRRGRRCGRRLVVKERCRR
ncbi:MAG TPA: hypothetical protein VMW83_15990 [Spirochaetia bacterium]|nr:hypothetical protein [Spirochaetia bacterium]